MPPTQVKVEELQSQVATLRRQVKILQRERAELELLLEMTVSHSDDIAEDLYQEVELTQRESEERYRLLFDHMLDGFAYYAVLLDGSGQAVDYRFLGVNAAFEKLTGLQREQVMGKTVSQALARNGVDDLGWVDMCGDVALTGAGVTFEWYSERLGHWYAISAHSPHKGYLATILKDITQRKREQETLSRQAQELARSNAELERFAYVAAHHLQEPVITVGNYTQLLARHCGEHLDAEAGRFMGFVVEAAVHMRRLLRDLLSFAELDRQAGAVELTSSEAVLKGVMQGLAAVIEESEAQVTFDSLPEVWVNAQQLGQVFEHLIDNALKFRGTASPHVHVSAAPGAEEGRSVWRFAVQDNGIGIEAQYQERIFQVFERLHTRDAYPGTGIGLALCKKIVERHEGRMWVESEPGVGSTFYFVIPAGGQ
jgi:PAS domain S-box-containing protein